MALKIFCSALKQTIYKRQWIILLIELSVVSDGGQQHKSTHILVISQARGQKI